MVSDFYNVTRRNEISADHIDLHTITSQLNEFHGKHAQSRNIYEVYLTSFNETVFRLQSSVYHLKLEATKHSKLHQTNPYFPFDGFWWVLMSFDGFRWGFDEFWWVLMSFDEFWWVLMRFDEIWWNQKIMHRNSLIWLTVGTSLEVSDLIELIHDKNVLPIEPLTNQPKKGPLGPRVVARPCDKRPRCRTVN